MTAHTCKTLTDGCYRCELNRDEIEAIETENREDAQVAWLTYRDNYMRANHLSRRRAGSQMRRREFIAGFIAGRQG